MAEFPFTTNSNSERAERDTFTFLFLLTHRLEYITDKFLQADQLTTKQLLTLLVIESAFDWRGPNYKPSLSDVADQMSTSHQNIRQIVKQLETKDFLKTTRDPLDKRILRMRLTYKGQKFLENKIQAFMEHLRKLFRALSSENMDAYYKTTWTLVEATSRLYDEAKTG